MDKTLTQAIPSNAHDNITRLTMGLHEALRQTIEGGSLRRLIGLMRGRIPIPHPDNLSRSRNAKAQKIVSCRHDTASLIYDSRRHDRKITPVGRQERAIRVQFDGYRRPGGFNSFRDGLPIIQSRCF